MSCRQSLFPREEGVAFHKDGDHSDAGNNIALLPSGLAPSCISYIRTALCLRIRQSLNFFFLLHQNTTDLYSACPIEAGSCRDSCITDLSKFDSCYAPQPNSPAAPLARAETVKQRSRSSLSGTFKSCMDGINPLASDTRVALPVLRPKKKLISGYQATHASREELYLTQKIKMNTIMHYILHGKRRTLFLNNIHAGERMRYYYCDEYPADSCLLTLVHTLLYALRNAFNAMMGGKAITRK